MRVLASLLIATIGTATALHAQTAQTAQGSRAEHTRCDSVLSVPTTDSVVALVDVVVLPFDRKGQGTDTAYMRLVEKAISQSLVVPQPLLLDTFEPEGWPPALPPSRPRTIRAMPTLRSFYRVELHRDGHLTRPEVVGGVRQPRFAAALLSALVTVDTERLLPTVPSSIKGDSIDLTITVTMGAVAVPHTKPDIATWPNSVEPLFILQLPLRPISNLWRVLPGSRPPKYPENARLANLEDTVTAEFVIGQDSVPDMASVRLMDVTALPFAQAVLDALPDDRIAPLEVEGCPVRTLVRMPFAFTLTR